MLQALSQYMMALSVIDDNEKVTKFKRVPEGYEITVEKVAEGHAEKIND